ncbi:ATP-binding protein [Pedobacter frigiditerrae]|uniref:tetratricopeptide repeat-containing sensor histidine kinase n=1 Tax=Pedobacter frigiditerrae TaxID=2530452 RepID=UPI002930D05E|nr:ATP-binding protein [Pedobacter frigiditerrae]
MKLYLRNLFWLSIFILGFCFNGYAQLQRPDLRKVKDYKAKVETWKKYCQDLLNAAYAGNQNANLLMFVNASKEGLKLCKKDDLKNIAQFEYYVGAGFQNAGKPDSAVSYLENTVKIYQKLKMLKEEVTAMRFLHYAYFYSGQFAKRDVMINRMQLLLDKTKDQEIKCVILSVLSEYSYDHANYEKAIQYKLIVIEISKKLLAKSKNYESDYGNIGVIYFQIAETYLLMKQYEKVIYYMQIGEKYLANSVNNLAGGYNNYITAYLGLNKVDSALKFLKKLKIVSGDKSDFVYQLSTANKNFAEYYLRTNNDKIALNYAKNAYKLAVLDGQPQTLLEANATLGKVYFENGNTKAAISHLNASLKNSYNFGKENYALIHLRLAESYAASKDFEKAYKHYNVYAKLQDTLYEAASKKSIAEMDAKYHREASKQEIKLLNTESRNKSNQLKEEKKTRWFLIAIALIASLSAAVIYKSYKNRQKVNLLLDKKNKQLDVVNLQLNNANQTKAKLFSIISHDLRSPVSQLFTFLRIQQVNPHQISETEKIAHQKKLMDSASNLLATMEDLLLWSKSQMDHFELDIEDLDIQKLFEDSILLMQNQVEAKKIKIEIGDLSLRNLKSDQNLLIIILRNLLQNAINHTYNNTAILINAGINEEKKPIISIVNKGDVIPEDKIEELLNNKNVKSKSSGYGLVIVKELLQKINSSLKITSNNELTTVEITFG